MPYLGRAEQQKQADWDHHLPEVMMCPSFAEGVKNFNSGLGSGLLGRIGSYPMNAFVSNMLHPWDWYSNPSKQIFFYESYTTGHGYNDGLGTYIREWHGGSANYLFMDGHIECWNDPGPAYPNCTNGWLVIE